jgi:hypothetical protein
LTLTALLALAGCASTNKPAPEPTVRITTEPALTPEQIASIEASVGIPPKPSAANRAAYLAALERINPELIEDRDPERLVDRGRDQCRDLTERGEDEWLWWVNQRVTSPDHPEGFGDVTAGKILTAIRKYICPNAPKETP